MVYTASNAMTPLTVEPPCAESGYVTAETANSFYGSLPATPNTTFTQTYSVGFEEPMIRKRGKIRPGFTHPTHGNG